MFNYIPIVYTLKSRMISNAEKVSWFLIYPLFLMFFGAFNDLPFLPFLVSFLSLVSVYEIGYLYNDFVTVKKEVEPTIRVPGERFEFENHLRKHVLIRLFISVVLALFFQLVTGSFILILLLLVLLVTFYCHNRIRSRWNVLTYFLLSSEKYLFPLFPFLSLEESIVILLSFPICRTIEHSTKRKYGFICMRKLVGDVDLFRVFYYSLVMLVLFVSAVANLIEWQLLIAIGYFLLYRVASYKLRNKVVTKKHSAY